jgi:hypothetical protein
MRLRIANVILASSAFLILTIAMCGGRWAGTPQWREHSLDGYGLIMFLIVLCWFAGAVGLFFRKRLAWVASMIGVGVSVCLFAAALWTTMGLFIFPDAEMDHLRNFGGGGYILAMIVSITEFLLLLAISLGLLIGLLRKRKELVGR